jgi:hypothetical protein
MQLIGGNRAAGPFGVGEIAVRCAGCAACARRLGGAFNRLARGADRVLRREDAMRCDPSRRRRLEQILLRSSQRPKLRTDEIRSQVACACRGSPVDSRSTRRYLLLRARHRDVDASRNACVRLDWLACAPEPALGRGRRGCCKAHAERRFASDRGCEGRREEVSACDARQLRRRGLQQDDALTAAD